MSPRVRGTCSSLVLTPAEATASGVPAGAPRRDLAPSKATAAAAIAANASNDVCRTTIAWEMSRDRRSDRGGVIFRERARRERKLALTLHLRRYLHDPGGGWQSRAVSFH